MERSNRLILVLGYSSVVAGLLIVASNAITGWEADAAFLITTGLAIIVMAWLRHRSAPEIQIEGHAVKDTESFFSRNGGYIVLGGFVFAGLLLISLPILAMLFGLLREEGIEFDDVIPFIDTLRGLGESTGPTYYAFLLGLIYFLSPKDNKP